MSQTMKADDVPPLDIVKELERLSQQLAELKNAAEQNVSTETALRDTQWSIFQFLEAVPVGVFVIDAHGKPYYANQTAQKILGRGIAPTAGPELLAETYHAYITGTEREYPASRMPIVRALAGEASMVTDMEIHQGEEVIPLQVWAAPIVDRQGKRIFAIAAFSDITERRKAEQRLAAQYIVARALAESHSLVEAAPKILQPMCETSGWDVGVIWTLDHEAGALSCVDTYHMPGINVSAFVAMTRQMTLAKGAGLPGRVWADGHSVFAADVSRNNSFPRAAVAARCNLHSAFAVPIRCDGSFVGVAEFFSRRAQEPAEETRQMLEACASQVGQFIERKLGENELRKAKEEAERAARSKADVLAIMSHEIRTPLNAVIGMTGLLLETALNRTQSDYAETIRISSETLLSVINDILDFSKIESEKLRLEEHPLELNSCVEDVLDLVARQALEKNIELLYVIEPDVPPWISGDITRLRQILLNLTSNALKFTERGEVVVSVRKRAEHEAVMDLEFMVKDTGIGIPRASLERLFKPFSQVDTSTTRKYGGTGLGLAICSRLVEMMGGGTISVETQDGKGSTFSFVIPVRLAAGLSRPYHRANIPELAGRRVLVVNDSETSRRILLAQLRQWGMVAVPASSGQEVLSMVSENVSFDVVILDMHMPETDGVHLARELRELSSWKASRMVLLTSLGKNEEVLQSEPGLFYACATRPVRKSVLFNVLVEAFGGVPTAVVTDRLRPAEANLGERYPLRILVAEDNPTNQKLMMLTLEHLGYRPDVAADGLEVLAALRRQQYDLVFMDVEMPEMDGLEAARQIAKEWPVADRPIIVGATAYAMEGDAEKIREAGMDGYITKPIRLEEILQCLKRWGAVRRAPPAVGDTTDQESVDARRIAEIRGIAERSAPEIFVQLIDLYQEDYEELVKRMRRAARERNPADVARAAHRLKGTSLNLGVTPVAETCVRIESLVANNELASVALLLDHLDEVYGPVRQHLDAIKQSAHETAQR